MDRPRARSFPAALEPPQPIGSEPMVDEHGAAIPVARRDSSKYVLPRAPRDALEGACTPGKAITTPPLPSCNLLPGLSIGVEAHEPQQRPMGPEHRTPSLSKRASRREVPEAASTPHGSSREQVPTADEPHVVPTANEPHVMCSPRLDLQRRVSGNL